MAPICLQLLWPFHGSFCMLGHAASIGIPYDAYERFCLCDGEGQGLKKRIGWGGNDLCVSVCPLRGKDVREALWQNRRAFIEICIYVELSYIEGTIPHTFDFSTIWV